MLITRVKLSGFISSYIYTQVSQQRTVIKPTDKSIRFIDGHAVSQWEHRILDPWSVMSFSSYYSLPTILAQVWHAVD